MNRRNRRMLLDGVTQLRLGLDASQVEALVAYCNEIMLWNRRMNLVGGTERDLVVRHLLDSLAAIPPLRRAAASAGIEGVGALSFADLGSGAGFPGVPLAIANPDWKCTLIERSSRRASFLNTVRLLLGLDSVEVVESDSKHIEQRFDIVVCRAFLPYEQAIPALIGLCSDPGVVGFFAASPPEKSTGEREEAEGSHGGFRRNDVVLEVPFLEAERTLVLLTQSAGS